MALTCSALRLALLISGWLGLITRVVSGKDATKCEDDAGGCPCGTTSSDGKYTQDKESQKMCLIFQGYLADNRNKYFLSTKVDEFTLVTLDGSHLNNATAWNRTQTTVQFETGGYISEKKRLLADINRAVEFLTLVIIVDDGKIDDIVWDNMCFACDSKSDCIDKNCATAFNECVDDVCDLGVYVSWYGTDKDGSYLLSSGQRLSQFEGISAKSYYDYASNNRPNVDFDDVPTDVRR